MKIGLFGLGTVAKGFLHGLKNNPQLNASVKTVCIKRIDKTRELTDLQITNDPEQIFGDKEIDVIVELIDDPAAAFNIIKRSLQQGIPCISANKKAIARNLQEVVELQQIYNTPLLYEGAVGGAIPILNSIDFFFSNQKISEIRGILNGTTNYILTLMSREKLSFKQALSSAIDRGYAETDPYDDISGWDVAYKSKILAYHAFGKFVADSDIFIEGIEEYSDQEFTEAIEKKGKLKLVSRIFQEGKKVRIRIEPLNLFSNDPLYNIDFEKNAVSIEGKFSGNHLFAGNGAGSHPTGSAVLNDLILLQKGYSYHYNTNERMIKASA